MTPKEKAQQLFNMYWDALYDVSGDVEYVGKQAKQCALIAVDEIIDYEDKMQKELEIDVHNPNWLNLIDWQQVKNEIERM